ncbi:hypothetical protein ABEX30_08100 [Priestia aryabhattai]|uniref:hypothetical protein n=1 Tax=Priestia aryabhattai TaxID=412384 RepID=UPI003D28647D
MIEITGNDIAELSDRDLRSLVGLLCEADLRSSDLPTAGVTWGGHQNAKDGGIDVRVELTTTLHKDSFVPRSKTAFQVKKPDMPRASIISEMRPKGKLRQVIKDLVDEGGAYIIVSSQGSTADSALMDRKDAMKEALSDYPNASNVKIDFYDRERIAGWVRSHPSLVLWVRDKIGQPYQGWRAYGNFSNSPGGVKEEYILDDYLRIHNSGAPQSDGIKAIDGINEIRGILHKPRSCVRLVGLSGVGKTRFLQALFDERVGERPLNQSQVFYTDISYSPNPDPRNFAERIIALQKPAIIAIDNCPPDLHRRLALVCSKPGSSASLITVEYDVKEDQPEETEVFILEPASDELIGKVISNRFSHLSQVDASTIAKFSGGNARIAIALANTVKRGENLSNLRDDELFIRLFQQRNEADSSLLKVAEVCSLVYSFNNQVTEDSNNELRLISSLAGLNIIDTYQNVRELQRRELIQDRSIWRAVLPHAIANRLAKRALENIPLDIICNIFEKGESTRLLKSFSRRLSYLHESDGASEICRRWLSTGGFLEDITKLDELGIILFRNIAPINLELTISAIEKVVHGEEAQRFFSRKTNRHYIQFTRILRSLAYDKNLFERSADLLCLFALSESSRENNNSIRTLLRSLFYIKLSGTHATAVQRLRVIEKLIESDLDDHLDLAISLLSASLESWHFSSHHEFEFGARSRDYGFLPSSREEIQQWYKVFIEYTVSLAVSDSSVASLAKTLLAEKFRGLWTKIALYEDLQVATQEILNKSTWSEGWIAVKSTKKFDGKDMNDEVLTRLNDLESVLKPTSLIDKVRLYTLSGNTNVLDLVDSVENGDKNPISIHHMTRFLGSKVALRNDTFQELLPEILMSDNNRLFDFGQGLADGSVDPQQMWHNFCDQLFTLKDSKRKYRVIGGFLNAISEINSDLSDIMLNEAVEDDILSAIYPWLQSQVRIDVQGVVRLKQSLELGKAPIWQYLHLAGERVQESISDRDLCELLELISSKEEGFPVSIEILLKRLQDNSDLNKLSDTMISYGQELIINYQFSREGRKAISIDDNLATIIELCFAGQSAKEKARLLCNNLFQSFTNNHIYWMDYNHVLDSLSIQQPIVFLDTFLGKTINSKLDYRIRETLLEQSILSRINEQLIIDWCEESKEIRYPIISSALVPFHKKENTNLPQWTSLALKIITNFSNPMVILDNFKLTLRPRRWSGSRAAIMQNNLSLIIDLKKHHNPLIAEWARKEERVLEAEIHSDRECELERERKLNERFE